jgi:hypothetical protein
MRRVRIVRRLLFLLAVLVFLAITVFVARALTVDGAERSAINDLLRAEARGNRTAMMRAITGCGQSPACRRRVGDDASTLTRSGTVKILELNPSAGFSLGSTTGTARVAWRAGGSLPVTQCVRVKRAGNILRGIHIELLEISRRIPTSADCPPRY